MPKTAFWLQHPDRKQYDGIGFFPDPNLAKSHFNYKNLWNGFLVEPAQGDCSLYLSHIKNNIAQGIQKIYNYLKSI